MNRLIALLPCLALTACVYVQDVHTHRKGSEVNQQTVAQLEPGKTTKDWVLTNLGTPDRIQADKDGMEVYEYIKERRQHVERKFILLFSIKSDETVSRTITRVVMRNGIVESITTQDA
jgi:outer membrane protein assembly factor BamE (lipoprotein component of BamABCDE complex)